MKKSDEEELEELREKVKNLEKQVEDLSRIRGDTPIGPGPEGYEHDKEAFTKQAEEDAKNLIKTIEKYKRKIEDASSKYMDWLIRNREH